MKAKKYKQPQKIRIRWATQKAVLIGLIFLCILTVGFALYMIVRSVGMSSLYRHGESTSMQELAQNLSDPDVENTEESDVKVPSAELEEGQIYYQGDVWQYNEDIMTFLCMGVDARSGITDVKIYGNAGQADAIMLVVVNPHTKELTVINVNRDTMVDVEVYDTDGNYVEDKEGQLALQYAYGDGRTKSCELMEKAVSRLFYGIPIHGYVALDMEAIPIINDLVGGVDVTVLEDMTKYKEGWYEGATIHLTGEEALVFIREREFQSKELGTNIKRIERQKQYMAQFLGCLKEETKKDITFPMTLYGKVQKHAVTSFSVDEITYLASSLIGYDFSLQQITSIQGTMEMGEKNEEFYVDDKSLRDLVIETFYEKVQ